MSQVSSWQSALQRTARAALLAEHPVQGQALPGAGGKWMDGHGHAHPQMAGRGLLVAGGGLSREAVPSGAAALHRHTQRMWLRVKVRDGREALPPGMA